MGYTSPVRFSTAYDVAISAGTLGDNTLVAAVTGKRILVLQMVLVTTNDVAIRFESGAGGAALSGVINLAAAGNGFVLQPAPINQPWLRTGKGELLNLELSAAVVVSGFMTYALG